MGGDAKLGSKVTLSASVADVDLNSSVKQKNNNKSVCPLLSGSVTCCAGFINPFTYQISHHHISFQALLFQFRCHEQNVSISSPYVHPWFPSPLYVYQSWWLV